MTKRPQRPKRSNSYNPELREIIAWRITEGRQNVYPNRGGLTKCAMEFGMSPQQWSQYESGHRTPEDHKLEAIAKHLQTTVQKLVAPPENWAAIREEWLQTRLRAKEKVAGTSRKKVTVEQASPSFGAAASQVSLEREPRGMVSTVGTQLRNATGSRDANPSSKAMEIMQKIIHADKLRSEGRISTDDLASTLKSVDVLMDALCREVSR